MGAKSRAVRTAFRRGPLGSGEAMGPASRPGCVVLGLLFAALAGSGGLEAAEHARTVAALSAEGASPGAVANPVELTVQELLGRMLERSAVLKLSDARTEEAKAEAAMRPSLDPATLSLKDKGVRTLLLPAQEWEFNLKLKTPRPRTLLAERAANQARLKSAEAETLVARQTLQHELLLWIEDLRLTELELEVAHRVHGTHVRLRQLAEEKAQQALTTRVELALAGLDESESAERLTMLQGKRAALVQQLEARIGLSPGQVLVVRWPDSAPSSGTGSAGQGAASLLAAPPLPADVPSSEQLLATALAHRMEVGLAAREVEEVEAERVAEQLGVFPALGFVEFSYRLAPLPHSASFSPLAVSAGLELPIPGFSGPSPAAARASVAKARVAQEVLRDQILQELVLARTTYLKAQTALQTFRAGPIKAAAEASEAVTEALTLGRMEISEAVRIQERTTRVLLTEVQLIREAREAYLSLLMATGEDLPLEYRRPAAAQGSPERNDHGR